MAPDPLRKWRDSAGARLSGDIVVPMVWLVLYLGMIAGVLRSAAVALAMQIVAQH